MRAMTETPLALLAKLKPDEIRAWLDELRREERALKVLLRSGVYRHPPKRRPQTGLSGGVANVR
jgi:hypothetical protein